MIKANYLDHNSTSHDHEVTAAMHPYLEEHFGNPSSTHCFGEQTQKVVEND